MAFSTIPKNMAFEAFLSLFAFLFGNNNTVRFSVNQFHHQLVTCVCTYWK